MATRKKKPVYVLAWAVVCRSGNLWWGNGDEFQAAVFLSKRDAEAFRKRASHHMDDPTRIEPVRVVSR